MSMNYDTTPGDYTYTQNDLGKSASGTVAIGPQSKRNPSAQLNAGGADHQPGDHGGHLIAHSMGGRNDPSNLDAQAANVNQKTQANIERNVSNLAKNPNNTVAIHVSNYNSVGERPDATMINIGVRDNTTGVIDEQHISFQNAIYALQESWNTTAAQSDPEVDPLQNAGMTDEQREAAKELCGEEDAVDMRLGIGCTYMEFDAGFLDAGEAKTDNDANSMGDLLSVNESESDDGASTSDGGAGGDKDGLRE